MHHRKHNNSGCSLRGQIGQEVTLYISSPDLIFLSTLAGCEASGKPAEGMKAWEHFTVHGSLQDSNM